MPLATEMLAGADQPSSYPELRVLFPQDAYSSAEGAEAHDSRSCPGDCWICHRMLAPSLPSDAGPLDFLKRDGAEQYIAQVEAHGSGLFAESLRSSLAIMRHQAIKQVRRLDRLEATLKRQREECRATLGSHGPTKAHRSPLNASPSHSY